MAEIERWKRIAWAIGAEDLAIDPMPEPDSDEDDEEARGFRDWAERTHGSQARQALAIAAAIEATAPGRQKEGGR